MTDSNTTALIRSAVLAVPAEHRAAVRAYARNRALDPADVTKAAVARLLGTKSRRVVEAAHYAAQCLATVRINFFSRRAAARRRKAVPAVQRLATRRKEQLTDALRAAVRVPEHSPSDALTVQAAAGVAPSVAVFVGRCWPYSGSAKKYSAAVVAVTVTVDVKARALALRDAARVTGVDLSAPEGLVTLSLDRDSVLSAAGGVYRAYKASWLRQGRSCNDLTVRHGYVAVVGGAVIHAETRDELQRLAERRIRSQAVAARDLDVLAAQAGNLRVRLSDSAAAGNCRDGTVAWLRSAGLDPTAASATLSQVIDAYRRCPSHRALAVIYRVADRAARRGAVA